ncbi:YybH family protein [Dyella koreensis]|uniref:Nuclear transport factor 2 family protein n=1 Tax=Dyella koreensis TaxID=311235 RepID=A0ABW8K624_9GAMM
MLNVKDITGPEKIGEAFARIFNDHFDVDDLILLYEEGATFFDGETPVVGHDAIRKALAPLGGMPGVMESKVNFCVVNGDVALMRADYRLVDEGRVVLTGSSVEIVRRQADGTWRYMIDHPTGASLASQSLNKDASS